LIGKPFDFLDSCLPCEVVGYVVNSEVNRPAIVDCVSRSITFVNATHDRRWLRQVTEIRLRELRDKRVGRLHPALSLRLAHEVPAQAVHQKWAKPAPRWLFRPPQ